MKGANFAAAFQEREGYRQDFQALSTDNVTIKEQYDN